MALTITEDWIRERVKLKQNNLEDVRSLSLPGTYHEKIGSLGDSLRKFQRLKTVDLSRNGIESLQGLENLKMLEKLTLYYNTIPSLQELYRLRYNQKLQELDLRLNPVARNEPDYRLFLIHMLPNLRRLDDRAVRDTERKAALMHFSSDQATELTDHPTQPLEPQHQPPPRVQHVKSLAKPPAVLDEDDVAVIDMVNRTGELTGSSAVHPSSEDYSTDARRHLDQSYLPEQLPYSQPQLMQSSKPYYNMASTDYTAEPMPPSQQFALQSQPVSHPPATTDEQQKQLQELQAQYPNLPILPKTSDHMMPAEPAMPIKKNKVQFDPNLQFKDEADAYTSYKAQGHFTPNPTRQQTEFMEPPPKAEPTSIEPYMERSAELYSHDEDRSVDLPLPSQHTATPVETLPEPPYPSFPQLQREAHIQGSPEILDLPEPTVDVGPYRDVMTQISQLADKYWNGSKSLMKNNRFTTNMLRILREVEGKSGDMSVPAPDSYDLTNLRQQLTAVREENAQLREKAVTLSLESAQMDENMEEGKSRGSLIRAHRDVAILRSRLQKSIEENKTLQDSLSRFESSGSSSGAGRSMSSSSQNQDLGSLNDENEALKRDISSMNIRLKQATQMQELATMLQESHKSLVQTNDHLLREVEDTRKRHEQEVKQLTINYDKLRRTALQHPHNGST